jgi:hypothetical protein
VRSIDACDSGGWAWPGRLGRLGCWAALVGRLGRELGLRLGLRRLPFACAFEPLRARLMADVVVGGDRPPRRSV